MNKKGNKFPKDKNFVPIKLKSRSGVEGIAFLYKPQMIIAMERRRMTEMQKFRNLLDDAGIEWVDCSDEDELLVERTHFEYKGKRWSVIHGSGTYGGWNSWEEDRGLLEIYDFDAEPIGFLTAKEAFRIITEE